MEWLMIGSSPTVVDTLPRVLAAVSDVKIITCNSGWKLWPTPDVYLVVDQIACANYVEAAKAVQSAG